MAKQQVSSSKLLFKITMILFAVGLTVVSLASYFTRDFALKKLTEVDARHTSELVFEVLYTKMQDGWSREDLYKTIDRLNSFKPGLEIRTYRSALVEEQFGKIKSEENKTNDSYILRALAGETILSPIANTNRMRYLRPMLVKAECVSCHTNAKVGDVNGVIDMTFSDEDMSVPLDVTMYSFLVFTMISMMAIFFVFKYVMNAIFVKPMSMFVGEIKKATDSSDYSEEVVCNPKTYELLVMGEAFNALLVKVRATLQSLKTKNKSLEEHEKAIDHATLVSKTDLKGTITYANDKFCEISGYALEELKDNNHNMVRSPNMPKETFKDLWATIKDKRTWNGVLENKAKNGDSYFVNATIIPILDDNNEIVEYIGIKQDITELKALQFDELNSSVDKALAVHLQEFVDFIPVSATIVDKDSNVLFTNDIFNNKFSYFNADKITIDSMFIKKDGYVSTASIIDFKDEVINFQDSGVQKVCINVFGDDSEFYISIKELGSQSKYLILLFDTDKNIFG